MNFNSKLYNLAFTDLKLCLAAATLHLQMIKNLHETIC